MAYTIISQNNNTTTLTDGVNTITVPSRVNLTSGNFTIVEVNNNMATLEDGDGNVYRDIPCVATLVDAGGGGGSSLPDQTGHSGEFLTTDGTDASWAAVDALPDQTGQSGKFLTTDGTDASWSDKPLVNTATGSYSLTILGTASTSTSSVNIGSFSTTSGDRTVTIGRSASTTGLRSVAIGYASQAATRGIAIGDSADAIHDSILLNVSGATQNNLTPNTFEIANSNGKFCMMSADGTIPTARLTKVNTTVTLAAADWSSNTQTVTVTGMTATGVVLVSPDPTDQAAYTSAGILCTAQAADSLTFTCSTTPTADIDVNVVML